LWNIITISNNCFLIEHVIYSCDEQLYFQHHYSSLQCHMIFRNHYNILIYCSRNISDDYQCWKQLCCFIFLYKPWHILLSRILKLKRAAFVWNSTFCNIIITFTLTFDQFNMSLLNRSINFLKKKKTIWPLVYKNILAHTLTSLQLLLYIKHSSPWKPSHCYSETWSSLSASSWWGYLGSSI